MDKTGGMPKRPLQDGWADLRLPRDGLARHGRPALSVRARDFCASDRASRVHDLLSDAERTELSRIATVLEYPSYGMSVYIEDSRADFVYAVAVGAVRIARHDYDGGRHVLALMWPGDLFGLAEGGIYTDSACTVAPSTLYRFAVDELRRLLPRQPDLQMHLLVKTIHDLRQAQRRMIVLSRESALERIASFFADLSGQDAIFNPERAEITLPLRRADIADYLGLAVETVSRGIKELEAGGYIERRAPRLFRITNLKGLNRLGKSEAV